MRISRTQSRFVSALFGAMALLGACAPAHAADKKPNIVVMMTGNLGYGDLGIYGGLRAPTPRIDRLARECGAVSRAVFFRRET